VLMWAGLLALAALALFLIPPFLLGGGGGGGDAGASPTPAATAEVSAEPSVAPTPVPSPTPFTYKVKAGDTLSGIAAKYKVSVDDILAANPDLKDPNQLQVGQVLVIPLPASSVIPDAGTPEVTPAP
jgi:LysM repeat protein